MVAIRGGFDGNVFIPDEVVDLPRNQQVIMHVERVGVSTKSSGIQEDKRLPVEGMAAKDDGAEMLKAGEDDSLPRGTPAADLLQFAGMIDAADLKAMAEAIEEGCEQVDPDGW
jgi:hypothetical protein